MVGINSQIFSRTGGYMGLSFAIPIDVAVNVENQLIKTGRVVRGRVGVTIQDVNAQLAESFGLDRPRGALVSSVEPGGPADKAGVKPGDVILAVNGQHIERYGELSGRISNMKPGSDARLTVFRAGKQQDMDVKSPSSTSNRSVLHHAVLAVEAPIRRRAWDCPVRPLAPEEKQQAQTEGTLVVEQVSGPAAAAGVQPGDIILGVNGKRVRTLAELQDAAKAAGKTIALLIQRQDAQIFVPLRLS